MKNLIGKIWALPTTVVGLIIAILPLLLTGRKISPIFAHNAICFYDHPLLFGPAGGLTIGNVAMFQKKVFCKDGHIEKHEEQHTRQAEVLGIFYLPAHIICLIWCLMLKKYPEDNPLERGPYSTPPRPF